MQFGRKEWEKEGWVCADFVVECLLRYGRPWVGLKHRIKREREERILCLSCLKTKGKLSCSDSQAKPAVLNGLGQDV